MQTTKVSMQVRHSNIYYLIKKDFEHFNVGTGQSHRGHVFNQNA